jgi:hypothetical protein
MRKASSVVRAVVTAGLAQIGGARLYRRSSVMLHHRASLHLSESFHLIAAIVGQLAPMMNPTAKPNG